MDDDPFPGLGLKPVVAADQSIMAPYFACLQAPLSDYTFSQIYTWRNSLRILWTVLDEHLCVFANGSGDLTLLMPPIGDSRSDRALFKAFELMNDYNASHGVPDRSRVEYASDELLDRCGRAGLRVAPMGTDYVYDTRRMIDLAGGDLASKRQAKNRFMRNFEHRVESYDSTLHLADCRALLDQWKIHQDAQHLDEANVQSIKRAKEALATDLTLTTASDLGLVGMVVYARMNNDWSLRGFTFGEPLGTDQSSITIEKTDLELKGLAQFIFSEFCARHWSHRPLVNVGDDWGLESLAWTKMSYRPVKMLQKYVLRQAEVAQISVPSLLAPVCPAKPLGVTVRDATRDDLAAAVELEKVCFSSYSLKKRQLQYLQQRDSAVFLVAQQEGPVVGQGIALVRQNRKGKSGRIYSLAVHPDCRGKQIGKRLLERMIGELTARGVKRIYLEVESLNAPAIALYQHAGFETIGTLPDYYGSGKHGIHMMHTLENTTPSLFASALSGNAAATAA